MNSDRDEPSVIREWRVRTSHQWSKHLHAEDQMEKSRLRYYRKRTQKNKRVMHKWMREYERTLYAIPNPPEVLQ